MSNINNKNHRSIDCRLINDMYMDFMLSKSHSKTVSNNDNYIAFLDFDKQQKKHVVSNIAWNNSVSSDTVLKNIGFTGVDNGFISYDKDMIGNDEFLDLYTNSSFDLSTYGDKFFVSEVTGNTHMYTYPIELNEDYTALKGGFYQGFFKIEGDNYQTLPHRIENEWDFTFNLRRRDYETNSNILNRSYPENEGMFFFIGTRAENKFWEMYEYGDIFNDDNVNDTQYIENEHPIEDGYLSEQISLDNMELVDSNGTSITGDKITEIETDNKFIIFNQTENGFNINTWNDDVKFILTGKTYENDINYFQYLHHGKDGYDKNNIINILNEKKVIYNVNKDIKNNALGFKINNDGSISYRYISTCDIFEETSNANIVKMNEWTNIRVCMSRVKTLKENICNTGMMRIYIYINGYLKFISKELPEIQLKPLNDLPTKQEGVPYNISIGGGSQGLSERIYLDYYNVTEHKLPIEENFAGSFIGDIKNFGFITF